MLYQISRWSVYNLTSVKKLQDKNMDLLERKDAEKLLHNFLTSTLKKQADIDKLMVLAINHESGIPMKGIIYEYDKMEKNKLTAQDLDDLNTLMHFYGP